MVKFLREMSQTARAWIRSIVLVIIVVSVCIFVVQNNYAELAYRHMVPSKFQYATLLSSSAKGQEPTLGQASKITNNAPIVRSNNSTRGIPLTTAAATSRPTTHLPTNAVTGTQVKDIEKNKTNIIRTAMDVDSPRPPVAIIIPYRDRAIHLKIFLHYMTTFLINQNTKGTIYVIEQIPGARFNRAKLFNVGYAEALKDYPFTCFIFHDVDLIPENLENLYACDDHPVHMSAAVDKFGYKVPYAGIFGGVISLSDKVMKGINGFSNEYWGWGGEDDDVYTRVRAIGETRNRRAMDISRYTMLRNTGKHVSEKPLPERMQLLAHAKARMKTDGLSSLNYNVVKSEDLPMHKLILVDLYSPQRFLKPSAAQKTTKGPVKRIIPTSTPKAMPKTTTLPQRHSTLRKT